jgi:hypothetical protein
MDTDGLGMKVGARKREAAVLQDVSYSEHQMCFVVRCVITY